MVPYLARIGRKPAAFLVKFPRNNASNRPKYTCVPGTLLSVPGTRWEEIFAQYNLHRARHDGGREK